MSNEPSIPADEPVASKAPEPDASRQRRKRQLIGAGIGSAAIVAALLYANLGRRNDRGGND
jgi:hypothetical protein